MKIRTGFVSNSSTTSFCICGISFEEKDFLNLINPTRVDEIVLSECKNRQSNEISDFLNERKISDIPLGDKKLFVNKGNVKNHIWHLESNNLATYIHDDVFYFGLSVYDMLDNETKLQFKQRVNKLLEKVGFTNVDPIIITETWFDG